MFRHQALASFAALMLLAVALRLVNITTEPIWYDEGYTVVLSNHSVGEILRQNAEDTHPPLYYLGVYAWHGVTGRTLFTLRVWSVFWSLLGLGGLYCLVRHLANRRWALVALALGAINAQDIYYAQEARNYAQASALAVWCTYCLWRWIELARSSMPFRAWRKWALAYCAFAILLVYTHFLGAMILAAQGIFALLVFSQSRNWPAFGAYVACGAIVAMAFAPWIAAVYSVRSTLVMPGLEWIDPPHLASLISIFGRDMFWGQNYQFKDRWWTPTLIIPLLVFVGWSIQHRRSASDEKAQLALIWLGWMASVPLVLVYIISRLVVPLYHPPRFSLLLLLPFLALLVLSSRSFSARWRNAFLALVAGVSLAGAIAQALTIQKGPLNLSIYRISEDDMEDLADFVSRDDVEYQ